VFYKYWLAITAVTLVEVEVEVELLLLTQALQLFMLLLAEVVDLAAAAVGLGQILL
jgi:hypothetical protein